MGCKCGARVKASALPTGNAQIPGQTARFRSFLWVTGRLRPRKRVPIGNNAIWVQCDLEQSPNREAAPYRLRLTIRPAERVRFFRARPQRTPRARADARTTCAARMRW